MQSIQISCLCCTFSLAFLADDCPISAERIEAILRGTALKSGACLSEDFMPVTSMFLVFADFSDAIGKSLGYEIRPEGMALDWAGEYPTFIRACMVLQETVIDAMSSLIQPSLLLN